MKSLRTILFLLLVSLFVTTPAFAQAAAAPPNSFIGQLVAMAPMFLIIMGIFYFLVISPQNKELRKQEEFISSLKKGASVLTTGGLIARVAGIEKDYILLEVANGVKMKFLPSNVRPAPEQKA